MLNIDPKDLATALFYAFTAGGIYAAIRADIKNIHSKFANVEKDIARIESSTARSHERIDDHITDYHRGT